MHEALIGKLSKLPDDTKVYCGHEYTLQNLAYGRHVEPNNADILNKIEWSKKQRNDNLPTVGEKCIASNPLTASRLIISISLTGAIVNC